MAIDKTTIERLNKLMESGLSLRAAAKEIGEKYPQVWTDLRREGYKLETSSRIVPIHANPVDTQEAA